MNKSFASEADVGTIDQYLLGYTNSLQGALQQVSRENLNRAAQLLFETRKVGGRVFVAGNGGSSAISEHLCCDWQKGVHLAGKKNLVVHCLTSNTALFTAIANDMGYEKSFSFQLELLELLPQDIVVLISSSGNSPNVIEAAEFAKSKGSKVLGLTGFLGGRLKTLCDISLHVPFENYGIVEDAHQTLMHVLAQYHDLVLRKEPNRITDKSVDRNGGEHPQSWPL